MKRTLPDDGPQRAVPGAGRLLAVAVSTYFRAAPSLAAIRVASTVVSGLAPVTVAWLTSLMLDRLAGHRGPSVLICATALAAVGAVLALVQHVTRYADREAGRRVTLSAQARLFTSVTDQEGISELEDARYQDKLRLAQQASQSGPQQLANAVLLIAQSVLMAGGFLLTLFAISPLITILVLASAAPTFWAQLKLGRQRTEMTVRVTPNTRRQIFYTMLMIDMRAAKEIRLFGLGGFFRSRMLTELGTMQAGERQVDRATLRTDGSLSLVTAAVSGIALIFTAGRIAAGHGDIGEISILTAALGSVQAGLAGIVLQIATASQALVPFRHYADITRGTSAVRCGDLADAPIRAAARSGSAASPACPGIDLHDVWFRYHPDHDWILRGVNLSLGRGQCVALVGLNGAGKSTLIKLICRLYEPTQGKITWDGHDVCDMDTAQLRARIGVVFQDYMTYELSAADNIAVGDLTAAADEQRLRTAADRAGIDSVLTALPNGYQTMLSRMFAADPPRGGADAGVPRGAAGRGSRAAADEGSRTGVVLSGGQWQRVAIARAVLRADADLLILDEPSAGLDAVAENAVHESLRLLRRDRSSLLISHRLGAVRSADRIVVLDAGRITEEGTHDTLMAADGVYARMFRMQADGYQLV